MLLTYLPICSLDRADIDVIFAQDMDDTGINWPPATGCTRRRGSRRSSD